MFDNWNAANGGEYKWCDDICGENYPNNLAICARYLRAAFDKLKDLGYTNDIQMMVMVATSWNGRFCGYDSDSAFFPFEGQTGYYLPRINQLTGYGSTAGYLFKNSEYIGDGVFDDTVELE